MNFRNNFATSVRAELDTENYDLIFLTWVVVIGPCLPKSHELLTKQYNPPIVSTICWICCSLMHQSCSAQNPKNLKLVWLLLAMCDVLNILSGWLCWLMFPILKNWHQCIIFNLASVNRLNYKYLQHYCGKLCSTYILCVVHVYKNACWITLVSDDDPGQSRDLFTELEKCWRLLVPGWVNSQGRKGARYAHPSIFPHYCLETLLQFNMHALLLVCV